MEKIISYELFNEYSANNLTLQTYNSCRFSNDKFVYKFEGIKVK